MSADNQQFKSRVQRQQAITERMVADIQSTMTPNDLSPIRNQIDLDMAADANKFPVFRDLLKKLYMASLGMAESEPDMPSHERTEAEFVSAMKDSRNALAAAGVQVPEISES